MEDTEFGSNFDSAVVSGDDGWDQGVSLDMLLGPNSTTVDEAARSYSGGGSYTVSGTPAANSSFDFLKSLQSGIDYGLKVSGTLRAGDIASKSQNLQMYLATSKMDIARTQAQSEAEVARVKAVAASNMAKVYSNAAGSGANLASLGGTSSSLMLYLTIAGVVFTFIQVIKAK